MIGAGVPAGAQTPNQPDRTKSIPASVRVGMFGNAFKRCELVTAIILSSLFR